MPCALLSFFSRCGSTRSEETLNGPLITMTEVFLTSPSVRILRRATGAFIQKLFVAESAPSEFEVSTLSSATISPISNFGNNISPIQSNESQLSKVTSFPKELVSEYTNDIMVSSLLLLHRQVIIAV